MELILAFVAGVVVGLAGMVSAMRRAKRKPEGRTAKFITVLGGLP